MLNFMLGVVVGLLFSLVAVITGKKLDKAINDPKYTVSHINNTFTVPQAQIIKKKNSVDEFLNEN